MTPKEGFRFGFLYRCAEEGLTVKQAFDRARCALEKQAGLWNEAKSGVGAAWGGLKTLGGLGLLAGVGVPAVVGTGIGLGLAKAREQDIDPDEIRRQELISAYRFHADQARRRALMKNFRAVA
jgi:hypothetical protein